MPGSFSLRHAYLANDTPPTVMRTPIDMYIVAGATPQRRVRLKRANLTY